MQDRPHVCGTCGFEFTLASSLALHAVIHNVDDPPSRYDYIDRLPPARTACADRNIPVDTDGMSGGFGGWG